MGPAYVAAIAAVVVAILGPLVNYLLSRRPEPLPDLEDTDDLNVISALALSLAAETARAQRLERQIAACHAELSALRRELGRQP